MIKILLTLIFSFLVIVPFFSTPVGEQVYHSYQETKLHKGIYCQYVEWFGAEGLEKVKFVVKCKLDL